MKLLTITSVVLGCLFVLAQPGYSQEANTAKTAADDGSYAAEVTASQLHLRAGPTASYQSVLLVEQGRKLVVRSGGVNGWAVVEVPGGFDAWVSGRFVARDGKGKGSVTVGKLLVRPRPSTRYHQLAASLTKDETVAIVGEKKVGDELWLRVRVPQRIPLYCSERFLKKIGPASMAIAPTIASAAAEKTAKKTPTASGDPKADARFIVIEKKAWTDIQRAKTTAELATINRTLATVDGSRLSIENQKRHLDLERALLKRRNQLIDTDLDDTQKKMLADLEAQIAAIEAKYRKRIQELEDAHAAKKGKTRKYISTGIVEYKPDIFGRAPNFRITAGGKLRYYLIAPAYDLHKFVGKRVGVVGLTDRESGTGYFTVMVKRIEILADK
ncbi:MAG: SH3 domain-containing protein [Planctomycetota bacterium]|jgi:hypothetical protein